jgi:hypothetical protein
MHLGSDDPRGVAARLLELSGEANRPLHGSHRDVELHGHCRAVVG